MPVYDVERALISPSLGPVRAVEQQDAARVEHGQQALAGVERHIDGPARDQRLLAPGAQQLIGRQQVETAGLLAHQDRALQDREDCRLLSHQSQSGQHR